MQQWPTVFSVGVFLWAAESLLHSGTLQAFRALHHRLRVQTPVLARAIAVVSLCLHAHRSKLCISNNYQVPLTHVLNERPGDWLDQTSVGSALSMVQSSLPRLSLQCVSLVWSCFSSLEWHHSAAPALNFPCRSSIADPDFALSCLQALSVFTILTHAVARDRQSEDSALSVLLQREKKHHQPPNPLSHPSVLSILPLANFAIFAIRSCYDAWRGR